MSLRDRGMEGIQNKIEYVPRQDGNPVPTRDAVCDLGREFFVVHEQEVDLLEIVNDEFFEAIG
jgi:hypothetical protein